MHGRVKTRTSEEEIARKQKERALKVVAYKQMSSDIFSMRENGQLNGKLMNLLGQVLCSNPDIYTFWNIRREVIKHLVEQNELDQVDISETQSLYDAELPLTENCLRINPKSYSAWHHRCWVLGNAPNVDWDRELAICAKYLKLDERNFHCWDYRRFVVDKAHATAKEELQFSTQKIHDNFSNYSAWHYRSKLLPLLYSDQSNNCLCDSKLQEELELVQNAAFTDPNDSSAWFYQRWLLGKSEQPLEIISAVLYQNALHVALSKQANCSPSGEYTIRIPGFTDNLVCEWSPTLGTSQLLQTLWRGSFTDDIPTDGELVVELLNSTFELVSRLPLQNWDPARARYLGYKKVQFGADFGERVQCELESQMESCKSLIEMEPDSKWTLLTYALIMRAVDHHRYHYDSLEVLHKLREVDSIRKGYYRDLANRWVVENAIENWLENYDPDDNAKSVLNLRNCGLTTIYHKQYFLIANYVDLRGNKLCPKFIGELQSMFKVIFVDKQEKFISDDDVDGCINNKD